MDRTGTPGDDTIDAAAFGEQDQSNRYDGAGGDDVIIGGDLSDILVGETVTGGGGSDAITAIVAEGDAGSDSITAFTADGGSGSDTIFVTAADVAIGGASAHGGLGDDVLSNGSANDSMFGEDGDDAITLIGDHSFASGGDGDDIVLTTATNASILLRQGDDVLAMTSGGGGSTIGGGIGEDTFDFSGAGAGAILDLSSGLGALDAAFTFSSFEDVIGSAQGDVITGTSGVNDITGGAGNDTIDGGDGPDYLDGGEGVDQISFVTSNAAVTVALPGMPGLPGKPGLTGSARGDIFVNFENLSGSNFNDHLTGTRAANELRGLAGRDALVAGEGDDVVYGGRGADTITAGAGADTLFGGAQADRFVYGGKADSAPDSFDVIMDFSHVGNDKINLKGLGDLSFIKGRFFDGSGMELRFEASADGYFVQGDLDGDRKADFVIDLVGSHKPVGTDFIL